MNYEIISHIGLIHEKRGITKELNLISFDENEPIYDLRKWDRRDKENPKMFKGITLTADELFELRDILDGMDL